MRIKLEQCEPTGTTQGLGTGPNGSSIVEIPTYTREQAAYQLREHREGHGMSIGEAARACGIGPAAYSSLERGAARPADGWPPVFVALDQWAARPEFLRVDHPAHGYVTRLQAIVSDVFEAFGGEVPKEDLGKAAAWQGQELARRMCDDSDRRTAAAAFRKGAIVRVRSDSDPSEGPIMEVLAVVRGNVAVTWPGEVTVDDTVRADRGGTTVMSISRPAYYSIFDPRELELLEQAPEAPPAEGVNLGSLGDGTSLVRTEWRPPVEVDPTLPADTIKLVNVASGQAVTLENLGPPGPRMGPRSMHMRDLTTAELDILNRELGGVTLELVAEDDGPPEGYVEFVPSNEDERQVHAALLGLGRHLAGKLEAPCDGQAPIGPREQLRQALEALDRTRGVDATTEAAVLDLIRVVRQVVDREDPSL